MDAVAFKSFFEISRRTSKVDVPVPVVEAIDATKTKTSSTSIANTGGAAGSAAGNAAVDPSEVAIIQIPGRQYPVDLLYLNQPTKSYIEKAVETVLDIHKHEDVGDVLVFLPGGEDIDTVIHLIHERSVASDLICLPLYSSLPYQVYGGSCCVVFCCACFLSISCVCESSNTHLLILYSYMCARGGRVCLCVCVCVCLFVFIVDLDANASIPTCCSRNKESCRC